LSKVLAILREDLGAGFTLAGVEVARAADPAAARSLLASALGRGTYGVVIVEEEFLAAMDEETRAAAAASTTPLVIGVPGEMRWREVEEAPADDYVARLIRRAVGYQLNIRL
jgi:vacuolar-type H+-ATPase subunit F/Vma7